MSKAFLLDENLVILGLLQSPPEATRLWLAIASNCHRIAVSAALAAKYRSKLRENSERAAPDVAVLMVRIVNLLLTSASKSIWLDAPELARDERLVHHMNDWFLEDIAIALVSAGGYDHCLFVSVDRDTRENFNHPTLRGKGIQGLTIEGALDIAKIPCG